MKRFLRIAAVILVAVSLCLVLSSCSGAKTDENGLVYTLDKESDTYSVTGYTGSAGEVTIPAKYDTRLVTSIGASAFAGNKTLEKITLHEGITNIGTNAFNGCTELSEVVFEGESKLTELSAGVFSGCAKLDDVKIPDGVTKIGYKAFNNCTAMKTVTFPAKLEVIDYYAFSGCSSLSTVNSVPPTFKVKANAFYRCEDLSTLMTPEVDGDKAEYSYSNGMLSEKVEGGVKLIKWLKTGEECAISADVIEIHPQAFTDRYDITKFTVDEANKNYMSSDGILYNKDKTKLIAFPNAADLEIVTVAYGVKEIDAYAFCGNVLTKEIRLPDTVEKIGEYAFSESYIEKLTVEDNKITVGQNAFSGCKDFVSYKYFKKNTEHFIEEGVLFAEYKNSDDKTVIELVCYPLDAGERTTYEIPANVTAINSGAFSLNESLETITVNAENKKFLALDGILYQGGVDDEKELYETLYAVPRANKITEYELPETVTGIAAYAFYGNKNIVTVTLNEKCKQIPSNMFNGCELLKTLNIPANEIDFGTNSVSGTALSTVTFGGNKIAWEKAKNNATDSDKEIFEKEGFVIDFTEQ